MLHTPQFPGHIVLHRPGRAGLDRLLGDPRHPPLGPDLPQHGFQHEMDKGSVLRGMEPRRAAVLCPQAVAEEIGKVTGLILIHPRGRHSHLLPVQRRHPVRRQPSPGPVGRPIQAAKQRVAEGIVRQSLSDLGQSGRHGTQLIQGGRRPPLGRRRGKQTVQPFHQEGGAFLAPSRPLERPGDAEAFRGLGTGGIHNGILPADLLLQPG